MKQQISTTAIANIKQAFAYVGLPVSDIKTDKCTTRLNCVYSCNVDGSIRWVWSANNHQPDFLRLYHAKGFRPLVFTVIVKLLFLFRLQRFFVKGGFTVYTDLLNTDFLNNRWALFTGTVGPNQKMILWKQANNNESVFYKIALSANAEANIKQEENALHFLAKQAFKFIQYPNLLSANKQTIELSDIGCGVFKTNQIAQLPQTALQNWSTPVAAKQIKDILFGNKTAAINYTIDKRFAPAFINKIQQLESQIDVNAFAAVAPSHGDFTPWNVWMKNNQLVMIDWELFAQESSALTDVFHFVYQSNILIGHNGYATIRKQLNELFEQPSWKYFIQENKLDTNLLEQLYLLNTLNYYLQVYSKQPKWHLQVEWLLQTWNEALSSFICTSDIRKTVLNDVAILLHNKPYAAMKFMHDSFEDVSENSDIDLCISKSDTSLLIDALKKHQFVTNLGVQKFSHMCQLNIELTDGSLIHIDCINRVQRKALQFMNCNEIIANARLTNAGIKVAALEHDFMYTWLFYWLNNASVPMHYQQFFSAKAETQLQFLNNYLFIKWNGFIHSYKDVFTMKNELLNPIKMLIKEQPANKGFNYIIHSIQYIMDILRKLFPAKGCVITFSGVDGAGKSTVIEKVRFMIEKKYRKPVIVLRHRPSLLPILSAWKHGKEKAEQKAANTLPRQGQNNSYLSSLVRFAYYFSDYLFGQLYIQCKYVLRGYIVLYDRYYFDFINDSKRSNITLPKSFTSWWYKFLIKPKFNFFLYASAEEILVRKKELDAETITVLTNQYLTLFNSLSVKYKCSDYIPVYNKDLQTTLKLIESKVMLHKDIQPSIKQLCAAAL